MVLNEQMVSQLCGRSSAFTDGTQYRLPDLEDLKVLDLSVTNLQGYYENPITSEAGSELGNAQRSISDCHCHHYY